ncbi:MAG: tRNA dihydrouridine synthase DusB [Ruminiclostridium sp.]|nr:tRNA dihydrouridine synthase DusB [Ruminiclostridium sp.]
MKIGNFTPKNNIFLAPMAGITDMPFRFLCSKMGAGFTYTEMISSKGMCYNDKKTKQLTVIHPDEAPCAVQIFGSEPDIMAKAAEKLSSRDDVAIIDINMGCPATKIVKNGEGCALMQDERLASQIIKAVVKASVKPVTVKFRKGYESRKDHENCNGYDECNRNDSRKAVEFAKIAEESGANAITVHGRTREQFYSGNSDMDTIARVKQAVNIPVIGNGDVFTPEKAKEMLEVTGCDAVMIGRGAQGNPWLFKRIFHYIYNNELLPYPANAEKLKIIKEHYEMMITLKGEIMAVKEMRKHLAWYIKGMPGASKLRTEIFMLTAARDVLFLLEEYFSSCCN